jgi:hypothetical protein
MGFVGKKTISTKPIFLARLKAKNSDDPSRTLIRQGKWKKLAKRRENKKEERNKEGRK